MDKKAQTHERILEAASRTLRREGFRGVTVATAMKDAGLTHGGFYAHFSSQDALLGEVLERAGADGYRRMAETVEEAHANRGISRFRAFVEAYLSERHAGEPERGCVVSALCAEVPRQSDQVRAVAGRQLATLVESVAQVLEPALAPAVAATLLGALSMARILPIDARSSLLDSVRSDLLERFDGSAPG